MAAARQVPGAKIALQHNLGLHTAIVVSLYKLGFPEAVAKFNEENNDNDNVIGDDVCFGYKN